MHAEFFEAWFEHELMLLTESTVVIMDNASFYRKNCLNNIANIAQKYGITIIFLPTY